MADRILHFGTPLVALGGLLALLMGVRPGVPIAIALGALVGISAELAARSLSSWPEVRHRLGWTMWILPAMTTVAAALATAQLDPRLGRIVPVLGVAAVAAEMFLQHAEVEQDEIGNGYRVGFHILSYLTAFALFTLIYQTKERSLITGTAIALVSFALAAVLLREVSSNRRRTMLYATIVGLVAGETTWAVNYWVVLALVGGALLLLVFYVLVGIAQAILDRNLDRRVLLEYTVVGLLGFALILSTGPWRL
jgi:hypothetical protein